MYRETIRLRSVCIDNILTEKFENNTSTALDYTPIELTITDHTNNLNAHNH